MADVSAQSDQRKEYRMNVQTVTYFQVSQKAEEVIAVGRRHHWRFRIIPDFQGVISHPVIDHRGEWIYMPSRKEDEVIIPTAALRRHAAIEKAGYRIVQVIIGHEIKVGPEVPQPVSVPKPEPKVNEVFTGHKISAIPEVPQPMLVPEVGPTPKTDIDWGRVADVAARGLLVGLAGVAMISVMALAGAVRIVDPSYCVVLAGDAGTVVELIRWNSEA
jgi:hypothetical protein